MALQRINRGMDNGAEAIQANFEQVASRLEELEKKLAQQSQDSLTVSNNINVGGSITAKDKITGNDLTTTVLHFIRNGETVSLRYEPTGYAGGGLYFHDSKGDHKVG